MSSEAGSVQPEARPAERPLVGITMGDPGGIGPEVVVKALADPGLRAEGRFIIYGMESPLRRAARRAGISPFWFPASASELTRIDSGVVVYDLTGPDSLEAESARPSIAGGMTSLRFLDEALEAARAGHLDALVTGPIHKVSWSLAGCRFAGHTEKLADAFKIRRVTMMFAADNLRLALASTHVPLFELRNQFTIGLVFQPIDLLAEALTCWFGIEQPRIAVAGLNPHASDDGRFGDEERRIIDPALTMARQVGIDVQGPFPADTLFTPAQIGRYDGIVAMYHDQGLIPVKLLAFNRAVNLTLGLPTIRTSVDHGTAFDIAGTNQADAGSMRQAIRLACTIARRGATPSWTTARPVTSQL